jgi:putative ABC transport system permease protein
MLTLRDLRYAIRALRQAPGRTLLLVLTLAVGIGANSAMFSFVSAVLLRPLPIPDLDRMVSVWKTKPSSDSLLSEPSYPVFEAWQNSARSFDGMAAMSSVNLTFTWQTHGEPQTLTGRVVSLNFFDVLRVAPAQGRSFTLDEGRSGTRDRVVVISHGLWQRAFAANPAAVGTSIRLGDASFVVIGVMPRDFRYPAQCDLWTPLVPAYPALAADPHVGWLQVVGRVKAGIDIRTARAEIEQFVRAEPSGSDRSAVLVPLTSEIFGHTRAAVAALFGATLLVLVLACVNASNILLAAAAGQRRHREIRLALGATRTRLAVEAMAEGLILAALGSVLGLLTAWSGLGALKRLAPAGLPQLEHVSIDGRVLSLSAALLVLAAILVSIAPILTTPATAAGLSSAPAHTGTRRERRLRAVFVVTQIATALTVLVGSTLVIRSFVALRQENLGFDPDRVLTFTVDLPDWRYSTTESKRQFYAALMNRIKSLPNVAAAAAAYLRPLQYGTIGMDAPVVLEGQPFRADSARSNPLVNWEVVTPDYFAALGITLKAGRFFTVGDRADSEPVVILGESAARRLWPNDNAIGKRLLTIDGPVDPQGHPRWQRIVGIVGDVRYREITGTRLDVYLPDTQSETPAKCFVVRTQGNPLQTLGAVRAIVRNLDPQQPIDAATTMGDVVAEAQAPWRFNALLFGVFGALSLLLAAIGVFGVLMCVVIDRLREFAIRSALGASPRNILGLLMRQTLRLAGTGLVVGAFVALAVSRMLTSLLYGVAAVELSSFLIASGLVALVAALGAWIPARRAVSVEPVGALRR